MQVYVHARVPASSLLSVVLTASHAAAVDSSMTPAQAAASATQSAVSQSAVRVQVAAWPYSHDWAAARSAAVRSATISSQN